MLVGGKYRRILRVSIICIFLLTGCRERRSSNAHTASDGNLNDSDYLISATMELLKPIDISSMNTEWQTAVLRSESSNSVTVDITINPYYDFASKIKENPNWRVDNPRDPLLKQYLDPGVTTNWDSGMRDELIRMLKTDGINPDQLTDVELVRAVSRWLFATPKAQARFKYNSLFIPYYLNFSGGSISVAPESRRSFDKEKSKAQITSDDEAIKHGILGKRF